MELLLIETVALLLREDQIEKKRQVFPSHVAANDFGLLGFMIGIKLVLIFETLWENQRTINI